MPFLIGFVLTASLCSSGILTSSGFSPAQELNNRATRAANLGDFRMARALYLRELALLAATNDLGESGPVYSALGEIEQVAGRFPSAESSYQRSIALSKQYLKPHDIRLATALDDLGWLYVTWGRFQAGSRLMDEASELAEGAPGSDPELIRHLDAQAAYRVVQGKYSEAEKDWDRALRIGKAIYGPHAHQYASILIHYGQALDLFSDYARAVEFFRDYLSIEQHSRTDPGSSLAVAAGELAHAYTQLRKFQDAQIWFRYSLGIFKQDRDQAPLAYSMVLSYLGDYYMAKADWNQAAEQYREELEIQRGVLGENHAVASTMMSLSGALRKLHQKHESKQLEENAKAILAAERRPSQQTIDVLALRRQ